jgi:hypothetical protein
MAVKNDGVRMLTVFKGFVGGLGRSNPSGFILGHEFLDCQKVREAH